MHTYKVGYAFGSTCVEVETGQPDAIFTCAVNGKANCSVWVGERYRCRVYSASCALGETVAALPSSDLVAPCLWRPRNHEVSDSIFGRGGRISTASNASTVLHRYIRCTYVKESSAKLSRSSPLRRTSHNLSKKESSHDRFHCSTNSFTLSNLVA